MGVGSRPRTIHTYTQRRKQVAFGTCSPSAVAMWITSPTVLLPVSWLVPWNAFGYSFAQCIHVGHKFGSSLTRPSGRLSPCTRTRLPSLYVPVARSAVIAHSTHTRGTLLRMRVFHTCTWGCWWTAPQPPRCAASPSGAPAACRVLAHPGTRPANRSREPLPFCSG